MERERDGININGEAGRMYKANDEDKRKKTGLKRKKKKRLTKIQIGTQAARSKLEDVVHVVPKFLKRGEGSKLNHRRGPTQENGRVRHERIKHTDTRYMAKACTKTHLFLSF